ncbi:hypothetical protein LAZ67_7002938 [Cordylochernes scorpioides]|uniref:Transposase n=1 Tax=Cordylochernes scorpioides TaxID=51811 RepID=A0ABY6KQ53_9ARAC|nr:hypothetical protein LAZ67_7002938 [Cordylochernes scorpioides]
MPGHRKRRQFKQTDAFTRGMVIGLKRADHSISTSTISRRLVANGLHSCRPLSRLPLIPPNRRQRLEWCRARSTWMTEWHRVVFSDESRFCLSSDSRRVRVWRRRGERSNPAAIVERPTVRQRGIMVWGAIVYDSRSPLLRIQGTMTAQRYVDDVLRPVTLPYLQGVPNALYQQDNARPHTARISQQALQDVQMLPLPPYSPDLSPIEHVWDIIGRRLHALPQPRSEDELWQMPKINCHHARCSELEDALAEKDALILALRSHLEYVVQLLDKKASTRTVGVTATFKVSTRSVGVNPSKKNRGTFEMGSNLPALEFEVKDEVPGFLPPASTDKMARVFNTVQKRPGRPKFQRTDENVQKITDLIKENPRTTLLELEQDTGISKTTIGRIVTEDLKLKKTPAKFIPRFLTNEQKLCRLATCEDMMEMTRTDPEWKDKIITGDETWVYGYDPETKPQSAEWRDIAPNDFFLFPKLKAVLKGRHFDTMDDIIEKSPLALKSIPKEAYKNCFDNWEKRWRCPETYVTYLPKVTCHHARCSELEDALEEKDALILALRNHLKYAIQLLDRKVSTKSIGVSANFKASTRSVGVRTSKRYQYTSETGSECPRFEFEMKNEVPGYLPVEFIDQEKPVSDNVPKKAGFIKRAKQCLKKIPTLRKPKALNGNTNNAKKYDAVNKELDKKLNKMCKMTAETKALHSVMNKLKAKQKKKEGIFWSIQPGIILLDIIQGILDKKEENETSGCHSTCLLMYQSDGSVYSRNKTSRTGERNIWWRRWYDQPKVTCHHARCSELEDALEEKDALILALRNHLEYAIQLLDRKVSTKSIGVSANFKRLTPGIHSSVKAKTRLQDDDVPIDDTTQSRSSRHKKKDAKVLGTRFQDFDGILGRSTSDPCQ